MPTASLLRPVAALALVAAALTACSSDTATTTAPPSTEDLNYTSASGAISIAVPDEWEDIRSVLGEPGDPSMVFEGAWLLDGDLVNGGSSVVIVSYGETGLSSEEVARQVFTVAEGLYPGSELVLDGSFDTRSGSLIRHDYTSSGPEGAEGENWYVSSLAGVLNGTTIEVAITLVEPEGESLLNAGLAAVGTLTVN